MGADVPPPVDIAGVPTFDMPPAGEGGFPLAAPPPLPLGVPAGGSPVVPGEFASGAGDPEVPAVSGELPVSFGGVLSVGLEPPAELGSASPPITPVQAPSPAAMRIPLRTQPNLGD